MEQSKLKTFTSLQDFLEKFFDLFKGSDLISTFLKTDRKFAEKVLITVALKNDCKS